MPKRVSRFNSFEKHFDSSFKINENIIKFKLNRLFDALCDTYGEEKTIDICMA